MSFMFPKVPKPLPVEPLPTRADPEIDKRREELRLAKGRSKGRKANILTSPLGATDTPEVSRAALLGQPA